MAFQTGNTLVTKACVTLCIKFLNRKVNGAEFAEACRARSYTQEQITKATEMAAKLIADGHTEGGVYFGKIDFTAYS